MLGQCDTTMKRLIDFHLQNWKNDPDRKSLLLRGARQVGKTYSCRELGQSFENFVEINFEINPQLTEIFNRDLEPQRIIRDLGLLTGADIVPGKTLLFSMKYRKRQRPLSRLDISMNYCRNCMSLPLVLFWTLCWKTSASLLDGLHLSTCTLCLFLNLWRPKTIKQ